MFILRRLYSRHSVSAKYLKKSKIDPGISGQRKLFEENEQIEDIDFDELESDFMNVHKTHREHLKQMEAFAEQEKYYIVKQKYFKEKYPNFLTWHDKEQMRYLHQKDPEEWTIEKLSEGFPALPDVVKKIVEAKWSKNSLNKIAAHDKAVIKNWSDYKQGKLNNLPAELKKHLQMFSNRILNLKPFDGDSDKIVVKTNTEHKTSGDFAEIIASYERLKSKSSKPSTNDESNPENVYFNLEENKKKIFSDYKGLNDKKLITFKELQKGVQKKIAIGKDLSVEDKLILKESPKVETSELGAVVELEQNEISRIIKENHESNAVGFVKKNTKDMSHLIYPQKILIPKTYYKEGCTYKLNDCYYDSDGEFLYRVPGMS